MMDERTEHWKNDNWLEKTELIGNKLYSITLSATNFTWTAPELNPGLSSDKRATNRLSDGTALRHVTKIPATIFPSFIFKHGTTGSEAFTAAKFDKILSAH
jgi:hypothetical protein